MKTSAPAALVTYLAGVQNGTTSREVFIADLFTISLQNGAVLYLTNYQFTLTVGGHTFLPFNIGKTTIKSGVGLEVDSVDIDISPLPTDQVNTEPILETINQGFWDSANVTIQRVFMPTPGDTLTLGGGVPATVTVFAGSVGEIKNVGRTKATITVNSYVELFNIQMPRNVYQPGCRHILYDAGCTLNRSSFLVTGSVASGSNNVIQFNTNLTQPGTTPPPASAPTLSYSTPGGGVNLAATTYWVVQTYITATGETSISPEASITVPANAIITVNSPASATGVTGWNCYVGIGPGNETLQLAGIAIGTHWVEPGVGISQGSFAPMDNTSGWFALGFITFTSGVNTGVLRTVEQYFTGGAVKVHPGLPVTPSPGDTFNIAPGCDKQQNTCSTKFSNLANFAGQPYVPAPEQVI